MTFILFPVRLNLNAILFCSLFSFCLPQVLVATDIGLKSESRVLLPTIASCGLNTILTVLALSGLKYGDIGLDESSFVFSKPAPWSLKDVGTILKGSGRLEVIGVTKVDPDAIMQFAKRDDLILIAQVVSKGVEDHFVVIKTNKNHSLEVYDFPSRFDYKPSTFSKYLYRFSGNFLVVHDKSKAPSIDELDLLPEHTETSETKTSNAASVENVSLKSYPKVKVLISSELVYDEDQETVSAEVKVENQSDEVLSQLKIEGSCSCFRGSRGPDKIEAKESQTFRVLFSEKDYNAATGASLALTFTAGGKQFAELIGTPPSNGSVTLIPSVITLNPRGTGVAFLRLNGNAPIEHLSVDGSDTGQLKYEVTKTNSRRVYRLNVALIGNVLSGTESLSILMAGKVVSRARVVAVPSL